MGAFAVTIERRRPTKAQVAWLTIFNLLLMPWERSRRLLVPGPSARAPGAITLEEERGDAVVDDDRSALVRP